MRVLKPGGHFCVSDVIATGTLAEGIRRAAALYVGCVGGAMAETDYLAIICGAGFGDVRIVERKPISLFEEVLRKHLCEPDLRLFGRAAKACAA
jgi:arsenite methyltransferase